MKTARTDFTDEDGMTTKGSRRQRWTARGRGTSLAGAALVAMAAVLGTAPADAGAQERATERVFDLEQAIRRALDENRDVRTARLGLDEANERVSEAWGEVYPSVDFNARFTRNVSPTVNFLPAGIFNPDAEPGEFIAVQFGADNQWSSTISVEQPLFAAGAFLGVGAAGRFESLQEEVYRGTTQNVVTRVRSSYYDLLLAQEQARLTGRSVERVEESLGETKSLNEAGLTSDYDVLRLEVELANLRPRLLQAENAVRQARRLLATELDVPEGETVRVRGSLATMELDEPGANSADNRALLDFVGFRARGDEMMDAALRDAVERRSDLRQLELTESLRKTEMRLEQVEYLPRISLFGTYLISAQDNGSPSFFGGSDGQRAYSRNVGIQVSVPLFQGFKRDARVDQKRAVLRQAETQTRLALDQARSQVRTLVEGMEEAMLRAQAQRLAVRQAQRGFEIASAQYREGLGSQLELTDSEVALRESEFNYAQAVYDYLVARARLDEATGNVPMVDFEPSES